MTSYMAMQQKFAARVERFLRRYDVAPSRLGRDALKDPTFVFDLRAGQVLRPETMDKVEDYMRDYKSRASSEASLHAAE
jgi:hypothetical protein